MEKSVFVNGKKVIYFDSGGKGEILLLVHGWASNYHNWDVVLSDFKKEFRILGINLPGYGGSEELDIKHNVSNYAVFLEDFIKVLELKKFSILAESLGAEVALLYTSKKPSGLHKLCLVSIPLAPSIFYKAVSRASSLLLWIPFGLHFTNFLRTNTLILYIYARIFLVGDQASNKTFIEHQRSKVKISSNRVFLESASDSLSLDTFSLLTEVETPTLFIYGNIDQLNNMKYLKRLPSKIVCTVIETKHKPYLKDPQNFVKIVTEFVKN